MFNRLRRKQERRGSLRHGIIPSQSWGEYPDHENDIHVVEELQVSWWKKCLTLKGYFLSIQTLNGQSQPESVAVYSTDEEKVEDWEHPLPQAEHTVQSSDRSEEEKTTQHPLFGEVVADRYVITALLGKGGFGSVYEGIDDRTKEPVAIKIQDKDFASLHTEHQVYRIISQLGFEQDFPAIFCCGRFGNQDVLVMEKLGKSCYDLWTAKNLKMPLGLASKMALNILDKLEKLHTCGIIHCDVKPDNIVLCSTNSESYYLVDFGLACTFLNRDTGELRLQGSVGGFVGTKDYASVTAHQRLEQSRKDDLESLGYALISLLTTELPWDSLKAKSSRTRWERIGAMKIGLTTEQLCRGLPEELISYFESLQLTRFDDRPAYDFYRRLFTDMMKLAEPR